MASDLQGISYDTNVVSEMIEFTDPSVDLVTFIGASIGHNRAIRSRCHCSRS